MDVLEAIKTRRSIRHYKPDPVDNKTLQTLLEAARWAFPNAKAGSPPEKSCPRLSPTINTVNSERLDAL
jgi:hypothetical protein